MKPTCEEIRDDLLVADLAELRGEGDSDVARHVSSCAQCQQLAARILEQHSIMATSLGQLRPSSQPVAAARKHSRVRAAWWSAPLAAAAVLALLLSPRAGDELPNIDPLTQLMFRATPVITPAAGQQAMVLEKNEMTIVWLYQEEKL
jgi:hypothetical protein